ncbi:hypothetical protein Ahy_A09g042342 isoform C [Arachis hypogaea]|uniref:Vacuole membrane protein n=1 Tax=Arachis hypogaea TaxID=3818 RepID=A0A445BFK9_ARAHY|nr:hypothetical protein Ahy_A09g042342 isoform C [Arachis hypogaea]
MLRCNLPTSEFTSQIPNPLFDLAGIMCGQFGVSFWKFFLATFFGKAIIKTHIQTVFIIAICNNQLLNWIENGVVGVLGHVPGVASFLPPVIAKLHAIRDKYLKEPIPVLPNSKEKKWDLSIASIWNTVVLLMLLNFFVKIVNATAQSYMRKQQERKEATKTNGSFSRNSYMQ